ncbi:MAG: dihydrofolate reductase family protein [Magnetospiraceae bacterium]
MKRFRYYVAMSVDGYIGPPGGRLDWLAPFEHIDVGYAAFEAEIDTVVLGRATFDQIAKFDDWPYAGKRALIWTSSPLDTDIEGVEAFSGDAGELSWKLRREGEGDVWIVGGGRTAGAILRAGHLDTVELFVLPVLLGNGIRLFSAGGSEMALELVDSKQFGAGIQHLSYTIG